MTIESSLPRGYAFVDPSSIHVDEAVNLFVDGWYGDGPNPVSSALQEWDGLLQESLAVVGVRAKDKSLVGLGFLTGDVPYAGLADLVVHPQHRHRGIARSIITERVNRADAVGVRRIDALLIPSNPLRSFYSELGFRAIGEESVRREI